MSLRRVSGDELLSALHHALARMGELKELVEETGPVDVEALDAKLDKFGLDAGAVQKVLAERWSEWNNTGDAAAIVVKSFVEGLLAGRQLEREAPDIAGPARDLLFHLGHGTRDPETEAAKDALKDALRSL